ncbi:MAG TPA: group II intron maturase-specific domain-containing protein [Propionibacteriaceae bacterium]|nr:group II intron maturase-specific domain-containing protein [Propionibacteriaceae bacterium]
MGLRLSEAKTKVCHIDEGFDFLGFRIQRRRKRGTTRRVVYTYPSKKALASIVGRVRTLTRRSSHPTLAALLRQLNPVIRGWCTYFRRGVSAATFHYLDQYTWNRVVRWIRKTAQQDEVGCPLPPLPSELAAGRGRRGVVPAPNGDGQPLPLPGREHSHALADKIIGRNRITQRHGLVESRMRGDAHVRFGGRDEET